MKANMQINLNFKNSKSTVGNSGALKLSYSSDHCGICAVLAAGGATRIGFGDICFD
jgi:hypothetical protein